MRKISIDDVDPDRYDADVHADRRSLTDPLGATNLALARYALEPGERFSGSVHAHPDQEEVFVVLEGEATFVTRPPAEDGSPADLETITVGATEAIRFAPGEFQSGANESDGEVVALALGAPRDGEDVRISRIPVLGDRNVECPDCGHDHMRLSSKPDTELECPECGGELRVS